MSRSSKNTADKTTSVPAKRNMVSFGLRILLLAIFIVFTAILTTTKIFIDNDVFWHLATGKYIVEHFSIPSADIFGFATAGVRWIPFEWGWDVVTYLLYSAGGYTLLSVFRSLLIILIFLTALWVAKKQNISTTLVIFIGAILCFGMIVNFGIRPYLISYLFVTILFAILLDLKSTEYKKTRKLYAIPFLFIIWANMHMGVALGIGVFLLFIISEFINSRINKNSAKPDLKKLILVFIASCAALLINPFFINTFLYAYSHTQMDSLENINEWKSPFGKNVIDFYYVKIYIFFLVAGLITLFYSFKKKDIFPALIYLGFGIYSVNALRYTADYMIIIFIPLLISLNFLLGGALKERKEGFPYLSVISKSLMSFVLVYLILNIYDSSFYRATLNNRFRETGFGVNEKFYPAEMIDFIKKEKLNTLGIKPFNNLRIGGYISWELPGTKNFIDSRNLNNEIMTEYTIIDQHKAGFEDKLKLYGIDCVIYSLPYLTESPSDIERSLLAYVSKSPEWKLIFWDDKSLLYVKSDPKFKDIIDKFEYRYVTPSNYFFNKKSMNAALLSDRERFMSELNRKKNEDGNGKLTQSISSEFKLP